MTSDEIASIQAKLGLSDGRMAIALGVTRQTWRNWRRGEPCPVFVQNSLRWLMELRRVSPSNDNLPERFRVVLMLGVSTGISDYIGAFS